MNFAESARVEFSACLARAQGGAERAYRENAWANFERLGMPDRRDEAWKYTSVTSLARTAFKSTAAPRPAELPASLGALVDAYKNDFDIAVLLNGQLQSAAGNMTPQSGYALTQNILSEATELKHEDGIISLAAAVSRGGFQLCVLDGVELAKPLLIIHCQQGEGEWLPTLNKIILGVRAKVQLAEIFLGEGGSYLRTDLTQARLQDTAELDWVRVQEEGDAASVFAEMQAVVGAGARLSVTQANCGALWARGSLKVDIAGERAEVHINGLSLGRDQQHVDQRVRINHLAAHTTSSQLFKGILKDRARGVLNGKIYIARHAQKVNSSQLNHNLLLSPTAEADTKPELEIYADDVKANHGASVGRMDEEKLFYLLSRGIARAEAQQMLARAFVGDVFMKVAPFHLRALLSERVAQRLPAFTRSFEAEVSP